MVEDIIMEGIIMVGSIIGDTVGTAIITGDGGVVVERAFGMATEQFVQFGDN